MARNMILFNAAMGIVAAMRASTELLSHTCKDKQIDTVCDDMLGNFTDMEQRVAELFADVEPIVQEEPPLPELTAEEIIAEAGETLTLAQQADVEPIVQEEPPLPELTAEEIIAEAGETLTLAQQAVIDAGNEEEYAAAQEAVINATEALEALLGPVGGV